MIPVALAVVAVTGLLAGAGVSPSDIAGAVTDLVAADPTIDEVAASAVASDEAGSSRVEVWFGPTGDGDGACRFTRVVSARAGIVDTDTRCVDGTMLPWADPEFDLVNPRQYFGFVDEVAVGSADAGFEAVAIGGAVHPGVTAMTARFGDGSEYSFVPDPLTGWFAVILPDQIADIDPTSGSLVNVLVELQLFDEDSRVLTSVDVPAWRLANAS